MFEIEIADGLTLISAPNPNNPNLKIILKYISIVPTPHN